jgi:hypothetical protein
MIEADDNNNGIMDTSAPPSADRQAAFIARAAAGIIPNIISTFS